MIVNFALSGKYKFKSTLFVYKQCPSKHGNVTHETHLVMFDDIYLRGNWFIKTINYSSEKINVERPTPKCII